MLSRLRLKNFTVFSEADFEFASGLNVIVGENGSGKSHVLKAAYSLAWVMARGEKESGTDEPLRLYFQNAIPRKLLGVFRPKVLANLIRVQARKRPCEVAVNFHEKNSELAFHFHSIYKSTVSMKNIPSRWESGLPVFFPTRELLSIYPGFVPLYETSELPFEETWRDTCLLLGTPYAKGARLNDIRTIIIPLEEILEGKITLEDGRFLLITDSGEIEAHLVAEGLRKLAMIVQLIATGSLNGTGSVYWDEPEANLNPKVIKLVARTILQLCSIGIQFFVASHSLFLLREFDILLKYPEFQSVTSRFFGLHPSKKGVQVQQGATIDDIGQIDALDEELSQSDRYLETEAK
jgi:energy-coupling factor transporter ATP-binding protein EcfA2